MAVYVTETLGPKQAETPEGYLLCSDVPLARTGVYCYGPWELQNEKGELLEPGRDGVIYVTRDPAEVFHPRTIASFEGKPVTIRHPATIGQLVDPSNWKEVASGFLRNVRRGIGVFADMLLGDLLLTTRDAIDAVRSRRLREVSLGYTAIYEQTAPGQAVQKNIMGNHVALVEQGRCGAACSIGDSEMANVVLDQRKEALRKAFNTRDAVLFAKALDEFNEDRQDKLPEKAEEQEFGTGATESNNEPAGGGKKPPPGGGDGGGNGGTHHHVTVNVNGGEVGAGGAPMDNSDMSTGSPAEGGVTQEGVNPNDPTLPGGSSGAGTDPVEMIMAAIKKLDMRLTAIEQATGAGGQQSQQQAQPQQQQGQPQQQQSGGPPPKKQSTQDSGKDGSTGSGTSKEENPLSSQGSSGSGVETTTEDEGGTAEGPKGADGAEIEKDMSTKEEITTGEIPGSGITTPSVTIPKLEGSMEGSKDGPELRKEAKTESGSSGQDKLPNKATGDSMFIPTAHEAVRRREEFTDTLARAEMLMPGVRLPTFDAQYDEKQLNDVVCKFKRRTLAASYDTESGHQVIRKFTTTDSPNFIGMSCEAVDILFKASSDEMRTTTNILSVGRGPSGHAKTMDAMGVAKPRTPAEFNAFYRKFFDDRGY